MCSGWQAELAIEICVSVDFEEDFPVYYIPRSTAKRIIMEITWTEMCARQVRRGDVAWLRVYHNHALLIGRSEKVSRARGITPTRASCPRCPKIIISAEAAKSFAFACGSLSLSVVGRGSGTFVERYIYFFFFILVENSFGWVSLMRAWVWACDFPHSRR